LFYFDLSVLSGFEKKQNVMITITGANGNLGKATLSSLLQKTDPTRWVALVRDPQKLADLASSGIQIGNASYNDPGSLYEAFENTEQALQISLSGSGTDAVREEGNVVHAAAARNVKHMVYPFS
jgi:NAD(P)H dehydrogenase (quinone)